MQEQDRPKREKKVHIADDEKKTLLIKQRYLRSELYLAGKEML